MLVCVLSVAVILPVNFSGDLLGRCFPSHRMTQECHASFQAFGQALCLWDRRQQNPSLRSPHVSRSPPSAVGQRNIRGWEIRGSGDLVGTWEMEKKGAKTRADNCNRDMHTALDSLNLLLLLFLCRTQSHPLRPDNHRQHPNSVGAPTGRGAVCAAAVVGTAGSTWAQNSPQPRAGDRSI